MFFLSDAFAKKWNADSDDVKELMSRELCGTEASYPLGIGKDLSENERSQIVIYLVSSA